MKNDNLSKFFKGKKVLVTGHTGFKGAWTCEVLSLWGANVSSIALPPHTSPNLFSILKLDKKTHSNFIDVRDLEAVQAVFTKEAPEIVIHLAAQAIVKVSYEEPLRTYETNVIGTANILQAIRNTPSVKAAVIITSDKAYENQEWIHPYREIDRLGGMDPYSASKAAADIIAQSFIKSFLADEGSPLVAIGRAGNVIGGGDWASYRIVPDIARAIYEEKEAVIVRNPESTRPWQFVLEPVSGYLLLAKNLYQGDKSLVSPWNFGPNEETSAPVMDLVKEGVAILGKGSYKVIPDKSFHEAKLLKLDISKARILLGWRPRLNLKKTLEFTFNWYRNYYEKLEDPIKFTDAQIKEYFR